MVYLALDEFETEAAKRLPCHGVEFRILSLPREGQNLTGKWQKNFVILGQKRDDIAVALFLQYGEEVVFFEFEMASQIAAQNGRQFAEKSDTLRHC